MNEKLGYCILEPGVGFYDLYDHVQQNGIHLQLGIPGNGWSSVVGNALERGFSAAGDHTSNICGLELLLANGELGRTDLAPEYISRVVRWGLVNMPRLTRVELTDAELEAITAYLRRPR